MLNLSQMMPQSSVIAGTQIELGNCTIQNMRMKPDVLFISDNFIIQNILPAPRLGQAVSRSQHNLLILTKLSSREPWGGVLGTLAPTQLSTLKPDKTRDLHISDFYMSGSFE